MIVSFKKDLTLSLNKKTTKYICEIDITGVIVNKFSISNKKGVLVRISTDKHKRVNRDYLITEHLFNEMLHTSINIFLKDRSIPKFRKQEPIWK